MLIPEALSALIEDGQIGAVLRQLKSGKEASVFVVDTPAFGVCAAKVYKSAEKRSFRQREDYVEGRRSGDSRMDRAMAKGSRFGREQRESAWQGAESAAMHRLHAAGLRIPRPLLSAEGVLLMELVMDHGEPAPQLANGRYSREQAVRLHRAIAQQVAAMLCAGLVHADLSEFNILLAGGLPVIIDLPQAVDAARNNNAKRLLVRDLANVTRFLARFAPEVRRMDYGNEMWLLHEQRLLRPDTALTGRFQAARQIADAQIVLQAIAEAKAEAAKREEIRRIREEKARNRGPAAPAARRR